jgi:two-component system LytT family response regulator
VVFVTAFDEFAIKAFKLNAVDYILKPLCIEELIQSVERLKAQLHFRSFTRNKISQLSALAQISQKELTQKITLKSLNHVEVVEFKDIYAIEGQGNYCRVSFNKGGAAKDMVTSNLISYFEDLLPRNAFYRVHKSYLINCMHIESITSGESYYVDVKNNLKIPVSRRRFSDFIAFLKKNSFYGG